MVDTSVDVWGLAGINILPAVCMHNCQCAAHAALHKSINMLGLWRDAWSSKLKQGA